MYTFRGEMEIPEGVNMTTLQKAACAACFIAFVCFPLAGQVYPVPIAGGDIFQSAAGPVVFVNQFSPGSGAGFDGPLLKPGESGLPQ